MIRYFVIIIVLCLNNCIYAQHIDVRATNFKDADSISASYMGEPLSSLPILSYQLTHHLSSDVEKFRAIYMWVSHNIEFDFQNFIKNKRKRKRLKNDPIALKQWNASFSKEVFQKLLNEKKTVCTGYAYLIKELSNLAGLACEIVNGYSRTGATHFKKITSPNHSWNAVQLDGEWYLCDATWSSGYFDETNEFTLQYNNSYFLAAPEWFAKNHYPEDPKWLLLDTPPTLLNFFKEPLIYKSAYTYHILPIHPTVMDIVVERYQEVKILCKAPLSIHTENITLELISGSKRYEIQPLCIRTSEGLLQIVHTFEKTGHYDAHIKIKGNPVLTYTVRVKRKLT